MGICMQYYRFSANKRTSVVLIAFYIALSTTLSVVLSACSSQTTKEMPTVCIAWSNNKDSFSYSSTRMTLESLGTEPVMLDQILSPDLEYDESNMLVGATDEHGILTSEAAKLVKNNTWEGSNVEEMLRDVDCVVVPGGADICPTMYYDEQKWHGIVAETDYSAERDVSDYILVSYCLEHDIPMLCICRGMQMLSVVSGANMTQDIGQWLASEGVEYHHLHADPEKKKLVPHEVTILSRDSLLFDIIGADSIEGVPSWHHQAVCDVDDTRLVVTATTDTDGKQVIEAVERPDKTFCMGLQFHPEVAVRQHLDGDAEAGDFMDCEKALSFFEALLKAGEHQQYNQEAA